MCCQSQLCRWVIWSRRKLLTLTSTCSAFHSLRSHARVTSADRRYRNQSGLTHSSLCCSHSDSATSLRFCVRCRGYRGSSPTAVQAWQPALCGSCPLVTPYNCRLGDLLCLFVFAVFVYDFVCACICVICVFFVFWGGCFPLQLSPSVLWYCLLGLLTCKNRLPYNLYCVGGDVKHCTIRSRCQELQNNPTLFRGQTVVIITRKLCYSKDDRAMRAI